MAIARITVELDGGGVIDVTERSAVPVVDGPSAAVLTQEAFRRVLGALGLAVAAPDQPAGPPAGQPAPAAPDETEQ